jgi:hypothetical protein
MSARWRPVRANRILGIASKMFTQALLPSLARAVQEAIYLTRHIIPQTFEGTRICQRTAPAFSPSIFEIVVLAEVLGRS